jgi:hypothetical protein
MADLRRAKPKPKQQVPSTKELKQRLEQPTVFPASAGGLTWTDKVKMNIQDCPLEGVAPDSGWKFDRVVHEKGIVGSIFRELFVFVDLNRPSVKFSPSKC